MYFHTGGPAAVPGSWGLRLDLILILCLAATLYLIGRSRLLPARAAAVTRSQIRQRQKSLTPAPVFTAITQPAQTTLWRAALYLGGLLLLGLALMSPIDTLGDHLFYFHMIQHLLLVMIVPPALLVANPFPLLVWGLPPRWRHGTARWLAKPAPLRRFLQAVTPPGLVWLYFIVTLVGWHDPAAYELALHNPIVHDLEHISMFVTALLFWWHVIGAAPHIHKRLHPFLRIGYVLSAVPVNMGIGVIIAFATVPLYPHYDTPERLWGVSVLQDQNLAGILMWIPGSMMFILAALILIAFTFERRPKEKPGTRTSADERG